MYINFSLLFWAQCCGRLLRFWFYFWRSFRCSFLPAKPPQVVRPKLLNQRCEEHQHSLGAPGFRCRVLAARLTKLTAAKVSGTFYLDEMQFGVWPHGQFLDTHFNISSFRRTKLLTEFTWKNSTKLFWEWPEDPFRNCGIISFSGSFILWVWVGVEPDCFLNFEAADFCC